MIVLVKGGRVMDPASGLDAVMDLWIRDGRIVEFDRALRAGRGSAPDPDGLPSKIDVEIDAKDCIVAPGFVDLHVHLREPGQEGKETIASGAAAAIAGGFTSICCMANTTPVNDSALVTAWILARAKDCGVRVFPVGAVTRGLEGKELAELGGMRRAGAVAFSDDGMPVMSAGLYRRAMELAADLDAPVISHCEDHTLSAGGAMHEGAVSTELGLPGATWASEAVMVARDIVLSQLTGARLHIAHVSSAESVRLIRDAKSRGVRVTTEASPHHLTLTDEEVRGYRTEAKMNPPLRVREDVEALIEGLSDGTIDAIATDHAPHGAGDKDCEFARAANGITGLETALPIVLSLVRTKRITLRRAIELLTSGPAKAFGLVAGTLANGARADITIFDPKAKWVYEQPRSKSKNSPWLGAPLEGRVVEVLVGGEPKLPRDVPIPKRKGAKS